MLHKDRRWAIAQAESAEELASKLTERTWTLCTGFELNEYLFLNDATHEDGAGEYAVVKKDGGNRESLQIESITMSWCTYAQALDHIRKTISGQYDTSDFTHAVPISWEPVEQHGRCHLCG